MAHENKMKTGSGSTTGNSTFSSTALTINASKYNPPMITPRMKTVLHCLINNFLLSLSGVDGLHLSIKMFTTSIKNVIINVPI